MQFVKHNEKIISCEHNSLLCFQYECSHNDYKTALQNQTENNLIILLPKRGDDREIDLEHI